MKFFRKYFSRINCKVCKYVICLLIPFLFLPLALSESKESRCAYAIIFVAMYWLLEPIPIAVTALLPVVLFPLLGILHSTEVCVTYMKEPFMMFIGGLIIAIAVEECMLHERVALKMLLIIGTDIKWLMMGFMLTTMFLSMWISNTATTAMMVPIVEAIVNKIQRNPENSLNKTKGEIKLETVSGTSSTESCVPELTVSTNDNDKKSHKSSSNSNSSLKTALLLCVCYAANIGGTGTLTGTGPNLVFKGLLEELHPESDEITFATWMMYNVPCLLLCGGVAWLYLYIIYIRLSKIATSTLSKKAIREIISERYKVLGRISFSESAVSILFATLVFLWIFRDPKFIPGWSILITEKTKIGDSVPAIFIAFLLFLLPSNPKQFSKSPPILNWKSVQQKLPWGVIILCGGGYAIAEGAEKSGLSALVGQKMTALSHIPAGGIVAIVCFMTAMLTEIATNTTTATILLPIFNQMAMGLGVNPLFFLLPVTITCSFAFMLPVATPPNAIAFESARMSVMEMVKPGLIMNIICCAIQLVMINTLGMAMFNLNNYPDWAKHSVWKDKFESGLFSNNTYIVNETTIIS